MLPEVDLRPPFNITRASHVRLAVADVSKSRDFYTKVMGLIITEEDSHTCYLRGLSEACHHSLVLEQGEDAGRSRRLGFRVLFDEDLDVAYRYFSERGLPAEWVQKPHQDRTLHVSDPIGTPLELCATMETRPRMYNEVRLFKGAMAQQFDHFQIHAPDPLALVEFYSALGFRTSEYIAHGDDLTAAFLYRKGTTLDLAIARGTGPRMHHFGYVVPEARDIFSACDCAGQMDYKESVERGPGRHGPGGILYVYLRDPDGHRVEGFISHAQSIDVEIEPVRWDAATISTAERWGLPAVEKWYFEASEFPDVPLLEPAVPPQPMTLERFLLERMAR
ncbi:3,4-dihydroxyphenylacetate 2,3-dioxygenase [Mycobacterium triplex]|uniref:3,4-dihydroxyphenylacetate 2,3-dioxygenase n=1 Tax=Mycobacterium triplex TaxID=47839 RepID=A0A024JRG9_9MYCO|nr:VOC family protein [Mycobacterium triplex]ORW99094.1 3,4-dihydroxyphenylacetate 2,3-dioxygenase [Mycobacterium triplex]CDO86159.1 3,4-dihydroxyphenylacetate 2,3-dioxygenase [Mycobacterium triplex]